MDIIKILGIEKINKSSKYKVFTTDNEYIVSEDLLIKHHLFKEKTFTKKEFSNVINDILEDEYFNKIIHLLSISYKSEYEIIKYIHDHENKSDNKLTNKQIDNILKKLKQLQYIDDEKLCKNLVDYYIRNYKGPLYIKQKLKERKIDETIINDNLLNYDTTLEEEIIVKLINKENNKNLPLKKFKLNLSNKLLRNGFNSSLVYRLIENTEFNDNSENLIEKEFIKLYNRVIDKDKTINEKKQLIINGLISKGYDYQLIKKYINESSNF